MVDTRSNMQFAELNSKPNGRKSLRNLIDRSIGSHFYPSPRLVHHQLLRLDQFHEPTHINYELKKKSDIKKTKISNACNHTTNPCVAQI